MSTLNLLSVFIILAILTFSFTLRSEGKTSSTFPLFVFLHEACSMPETRPDTLPEADLKMQLVRQHAENMDFSFVGGRDLNRMSDGSKSNSVGNISLGLHMRRVFQEGRTSIYHTSEIPRRISSWFGRNGQKNRCTAI